MPACRNMVPPRGECARLARPPERTEISCPEFARAPPLRVPRSEPTTRGARLMSWTKGFGEQSEAEKVECDTPLTIDG